MEKLSVISTLFSPPNTVKGMKILNREAFKTLINLPALQIEAKKCSLFLKNLSKCLLNQPRMRNIVPDANETKKKIILLHPQKSLNTLEEQDREFAQNHGAEETTYELVLGYEHWTAEQVLRAVLPAEITEVPSSFETIGHIAHVNLRASQLDYKKLIGQVLLDKNSPQIKTVVNKTDTIHDVFRFFKMEVIAGENNLYTSVKQDGCIFEFDFSKVYWNSRLQTEHTRLVELFDSDDVVCDMFAGVGPFAIPAAKKGCTVYGNDLNPASYEALLKNAKLNRVEKKIHAFNMDGRDFVRKMVQLSFPPASSFSSSSSTDQGLQGNASKILQPFTHVVMNLPASAVEFVDVFQGLYSAHRHAALPTIHCYCFSKSQSPGEDAKEQVEKKLGSSLTSQCSVHFVRDVAPKKVMVCVSFKLPESVAFADISEKSECESKRQRDDSPDAAKAAKQAKLELECQEN
ncbi:hypothetical protein ACROYT_G039394 [Oculina patagonica]